MICKLADIYFRAGVIALTIFMVSGCAIVKLAEDEELRQIDTSKGIVVGTVFESAVFTPHGASFYITTPSGERISLSSKTKIGYLTIVNELPKTPTGDGRAFALQLSPGKYRLTEWSLNYGSRNKKSDEPDTPIEFVVEAGKSIYLGRFNANRFMENAYFHDNYTEDVEYFNKIPLVAGLKIENKALKYQGWWLPNASGKRLLGR